jgi:hypothetical protein
VHIVESLPNGGFIFIMLPLQCIHRLLMYALIDENIDSVRSWIDQRQQIGALVQRVRLLGCELCFHGGIMSHKHPERQVEDCVYRMEYTLFDRVMPVLQKEVHRCIDVAAVDAPQSQIATVRNVVPVGLTDSV